MTTSPVAESKISTTGSAIFSSLKCYEIKTSLYKNFAVLFLRHVKIKVFSKVIDGSLMMVFNLTTTLVLRAIFPFVIIHSAELLLSK